MKRVNWIRFGATSVLSLKVCALFCLTVWIGAASAETFNYKSLTYQYTDCDKNKLLFTFPFVESDDNSLASRLNAYLHLLYLHIAPPEKYKETPTEIVANSWVSGGMGEIKSKEPVLTNGGRVLRVELIEESCSAFASTGVTSFAFDTKTGNLIFADDLLTKIGIKKLGKRLFSERQAKIKKQIRQLKNLSASLRNRSELTRIHSSIELYEACLADRFDARSLESGIEFPGVGVLGDGYVEFRASSCSSQVNAALDDLGNFDDRLSAEELRSYLSGYGKYIFFGEGDGGKPAINSYGQIFRGKINGNIPVTLYLAAEYPTIGNVREQSAKYYYDKYRTVINLSVRRKGDLFELTEVDSKESPKPVLSFKVKGGKLVGEWRSGTKAYSFEAIP